MTTRACEAGRDSGRDSGRDGGRFFSMSVLERVGRAVDEVCVCVIESDR